LVSITKQFIQLRIIFSSSIILPIMKVVILIFIPIIKCTYHKTGKFIINNKKKVFFLGFSQIYNMKNESCFSYNNKKKKKKRDFQWRILKIKRFLNFFYNRLIMMMNFIKGLKGKKLCKLNLILIIYIHENK